MDESTEKTDDVESMAMSSTSSVSEDVEDLDGELEVLLEDLELDESAPLAPETRASVRKSVSGKIFLGDDFESVYGTPLTVEEAAERMPPPEGGDDAIGGLIWYATLIPDKFVVDGKVHRALNPRDFDLEKEEIKPRRPTLPVTMSDFFSSLTQVGPRFIFYGILNGWPALRCLEVLAVEQKRQVGPGWKVVWSSKVEGSNGVSLKLLDTKQVYRVTVGGAPWTARGWSEESPGFLFWYEAQRKQGPRLLFGQDTVTTLDDATCTHIHMIAHRYAVKHEGPRDLLTYHSLCLLDWDHGQYMTVVELAYLNGIGGYRGRCNWYHDKDAKPSCMLYQCMPPELIAPWLSDMAEIRCFDVEAKNLGEFKSYMAKYKGGHERFIDPQVAFSHPARLTFRSRKHIAQYLLNYINRDSGYGDLKRNCQTFAAEFCGFIAGKKDVQPFHPVSRIDYQSRSHLFLYDSHLYAKIKGGHRQKKKQDKLRRQSDKTIEKKKAATNNQDQMRKSVM